MYIYICSTATALYIIIYTSWQPFFWELETYLVFSCNHIGNYSLGGCCSHTIGNSLAFARLNNYCYNHSWEVHTMISLSTPSEFSLIMIENTINVYEHIHLFTQPKTLVIKTPRNTLFLNPVPPVAFLQNSDIANGTLTVSKSSSKICNLSATGNLMQLQLQHHGTI